MQVADPRKGKAVRAFRFALWGGCRDLAQAIKQSSSQAACLSIPREWQRCAGDAGYDACIRSSKA